MTNIKNIGNRLIVNIFMHFKKNKFKTSYYFANVFILILLSMSGNIYGQDQPLPPEQQAGDTTPARKLDFNEADWGFTTARIGEAFMTDWAWYSQDDKGRAQMDSANVELKNMAKVRDFRVLASGKLNTKRYLVWRIAIMWDGAGQDWAFRETGLLIGVPELSGKIFIGRSKEGYSMCKAQNGYSVSGIERQPSLDPIPIMTDGIRYYGDLKKPNIFWSAGAYTNLIYGTQSTFMQYEMTLAGRFGWLPLYKPKHNKIVHLGVSYMYTNPNNDKIQVKSKPESNPAPNFIDTKTFDCDVSTAVGGEAYFFNGPLLIGSEVNQLYYHSVQAGNPTFRGGNITLTYNLTGEPFPYIKDNAVSFFIKPKKSVFNGGTGVLQLLFTGSIYDTNTGLMPGGKFWKLTTMFGWYPSENFAVKVMYGYGTLDRFGIQGVTQFFQTRFQFQLI